VADDLMAMIYHPSPAMISRASVLFSLSLFAALPLAAQSSLVAPVGYDNVAGNVNNLFPWGREANSMRIQFIYDSSNFSTQGVATPVLITALRYRPAAGPTSVSWPGGSWPAVQIDMATCPLDYTAVSATFASNLGPDLTTVHNGQVVLQGGVGQGAGVPMPWYIEIPLATPFRYDPTSSSDLTVDIRLNGAGWTGGSRGCDNVTAAGPLPPLGSRVFSTASATAAGGSRALDYVAVCEFDYVPVGPLYASFSANATSGPSPLAVNFTDRSATTDPAGIVSWAWDLNGDGIVDSTLQNPSFVYPNCGDYNVSLTVSDGSNPPVTLTRTAYIRTDEVRPGFSFQQLAVGLYQFTDTSTPTPTSWAWDFDGDGIVDSTQQNPIWQFADICSVAEINLRVNRLCRGPFSTTQRVVLAPLAGRTLLTGGAGNTVIGAGNTFDIDVTNPNGVTICALTLCPNGAGTQIGAPLQCSIWITDAPGGYQANHTNSAAWRLVATGAGRFGGGSITGPIPMPFTLSSAFHLPAGRYGMAVHMTGGSGMTWTNLTAPFSYFNPDFDIHCGNEKLAPFSAAATDNRAFNGIFHYSTVTNGNLAGFGFFGAGCPSSLGITQLRASAPPVVGLPFAIDLNNLPVSSAIMMVGFSRNQSGFGPLPLPLDSFGAPGCVGRVSADATLFVPGSNNLATWNLNAPGSPGLLGLTLFGQALVLAPGMNALGAVISDAAAIQFGL